MESETLILITVILCLGMAAALPLEDMDIGSSSVLRVRRDSDRCGEDYYSGPGKIVLPTEDFNGTQFYGANTNCHWVINPPSGNYVILKSEYFALEESNNCMYDYIEIEEGGDNPVTTRYCGWDPVIYISDSNYVTIRFKSDETYEDRGFSFSFEVLEKSAVGPSQCNSSIIGGEDGSIKNDEYTCYYHIQAPEDKVIQLDLSIIDFGSRSCEEESVTVYAGRSPRGPAICKICSDTLPGMLDCHAESMFIMYENRLPEDLGHGFTVEYRFVEDTFTPPPTPATTPSPVGGNNDCSGFQKDIVDWMYVAPAWQNNKHCVFVVRNTLFQQHVVQIEFEEFELEESEGCEWDYLKLLSGERNDSTSMGGPFCGTSLQGKTLVASGNSLRLEFETDESFALKGFKAKISFVPNDACECEGDMVCVRQGFEKKCLPGSKCTINNCRNGGTCLWSRDESKCFCADGFFGPTCEEGEGGIEPLAFTVTPQDLSLTRGQPHTAQCQVDDDGKDVEYVWTFKGVIIEEYTSKSGFGTHPGGVLQIDRFTDQMEGRYSCFAVSGESTAEHTFEYRVVEECGLHIEIGPTDVHRKVGELAVLTCSSRRAKNIRWKKDGLQVELSGRFQQLVNGYLQIRDVQTEDAGMYRCEAEAETTEGDSCYAYREGTLTVLDVKPLNKYCGISRYDKRIITTRISKGVDARPGENPWHVNIRSNLRTEPNRAFCGGTLISQSFVLTAAHCIDQFAEKFGQEFRPDNVVLHFGTNDCTGTDTPLIRSPLRYIKHPDYNDAAYQDSDIALLELDSPVEYTDSIVPVCLQELTFIERVFFQGNLQSSSGKVAGCGRTRGIRSRARKLQEIFLPYVDRERCIELFEERESVEITENMICAGHTVARKGDACEGDSGGALVMTDNNQWIQTGIVSWGAGCDTRDFVGVYTNVGVFYDWIREITKFDEEEVEF